jgi:hypothetical protein
MQSEHIRGCRDDPVVVQYQHFLELAALPIRSLLIKEATTLFPLLEAVIVSPLTPLMSSSRSSVLF